VECAVILRFELTWPLNPLLGPSLASICKGGDGVGETWVRRAETDECAVSGERRLGANTEDQAAPFSVMETQYGFPRTRVHVYSRLASQNTLFAQRRAADGALCFNGTNGFAVFAHTWYQILEWVTVYVCGVFPQCNSAHDKSPEISRLCCELLLGRWHTHTHIHTHTRSPADNQSVFLPYLAVPGESEA